MLRPITACTSGATERLSAGAVVFENASRPPRNRTRRSEVRNAAETDPAVPRTGIDSPLGDGGPGRRPSARSDALTARIADGAAPKRLANSRTLRKWP